MFHGLDCRAYAVDSTSVLQAQRTHGLDVQELQCIQFFFKETSRPFQQADSLPAAENLQLLVSRSTIAAPAACQCLQYHVQWTVHTACI